MNLNSIISSGDDKPEERKELWNTAKVESTLKQMEKGYSVKSNPFYEGDPLYRKGNIVFEYSEYEMSELKRCARDIIHFANTYCMVMTDDGYQKIKLRDYQIRMLKSFQQNRFSICLAPRQIGKCHLHNTELQVRDKKTKKEFTIKIGDLYEKKTKLGIIGKIKNFLYSIVSLLDKF